MFEIIQIKRYLFRECNYNNQTLYDESFANCMDALAFFENTTDNLLSILNNSNEEMTNEKKIAFKILRIRKKDKKNPERKKLKPVLKRFNKFYK